ncbi:hypothetical protein, partial [Maribacter orientalis]|uniref:hypothetical protein n=1 Tax=Maribacter orientalis TaxID=228957 RepID=UPI001C42FC85
TLLQADNCSIQFLQSIPFFQTYSPFFNIKANVLAMNSTGANQRLLSATHIAKSFCFVFSFLKQNPKDFADIIKIHKPFD